MTTRFVLLFSLFAVAAGAAAQTAEPSPRLMKGLYDETQTLYGNPDRTFPVLARLGTKALRVNLYGGGEFGVANRRPRNASNPNDPAYEWGIYDRTVQYAAQYRIKVVFSIWGTPGWANRFRGLRYAPLRPVDLQQFAQAAARRYSGRFMGEDGRLLARVDHWLAWNEPNNPAFLFPQYRIVRGRAIVASAIDYAKICNAVRGGVKSQLVGTQKVACGVTSPRGEDNPRSVRPSVSPLVFLRAMRAAGARGFDAYAHHPYYVRPNETPTTKPRSRNSITLANIDVLIREVTRRWGRKPIWITEYGYQTKPPDRTFGVSLTQQARYLTQAFAIARRHPRIDMMLWFLLRDERRLAGWQSGLYTASGRKKPAFVAFQRVR